MPMSVQMQRVWDGQVIPAGKRFTAYDFSSTNMVEVRHEDGTTMYFHSAFVRVFDTVWIAVYTEHNGTHLFHKFDLEECREWGLQGVNGEPLIEEPGRESEGDEEA